MPVKIEACASPEHPGWLRLRRALRPDGAREEHLKEMSSPVAFLEGLYVVPHARRQGVARALGFEETERVVFFRRRLA